MSLTKKEVRAKIQEAVGRPVKFNYPKKFKRRGRLKERVIVWSGYSDEGNRVCCWDVVDLIEFPHKAGHRFWIRIGYYRQVGDKLRWASQTTITEPSHQIKRIFAQAAKQKYPRPETVPVPAIIEGGVKAAMEEHLAKMRRDKPISAWR